MWEWICSDLRPFEVAYRHGAAYVDELNQYLYENAQFVAEYVAENLPAAKTYVQDGTIFMWLDFFDRPWD